MKELARNPKTKAHFLIQTQVHDVCLFWKMSYSSKPVDTLPNRNLKLFKQTVQVQCKNFSNLYPKAVIAIHSQEHSPTYRTSNCVFSENNTKNIMILNTYL